MTWSTIYPSSHFDLPLATAIVWGTSFGLLAFAVIAFGRMRRRERLAANAAAKLSPSHALRAGGLREGEILLSGVVAHADDHDVAVRVDVLQEGTEHESSGSYSYRWTEYHREVIVRPFYLELDDGVLVRVLAPSNVEVADALDQKVLLSDTKRKLSAELIPGETLHAQGWLERGALLKPGGESGYRDAEYEWQLVPNKGRMLLSSEPLGAGMAKRARFHRFYGVMALCMLAICHAMFLGYTSRLFASNERATIVHKETIEGTNDDGDPVYTDILSVQTATLRFDREVSSGDYALVHVGDGIVVRRGVLGPDIGGGGSLHIALGLISISLASFVPILYLIRRRSTRPWFRRQVIHTGPGQLPGK